MKLTKLFVAGAIATLAVGVFAVFPATPASADMATACNNPNYSNDQKSACEDGYTSGQCSGSSGNNQVACEAGRTQAEKDNAPPSGSEGTQNNGSAKCGGAKTEIVACDESAGLGAIASLIKIAISVVTVIIGIVAVGGLTYAAILYAGARDNQGQVQQAIGIIRNVVIGIVMYGLSVAIINWLIPGGVIG